VLRRRDLDLLDVTTRDGLRLATPAFAALETACGMSDGSTFLDRALQRRLGFPELLDAHLRNAGRPGFAAANAMIAAAADRADSAAERLLMRLLRGAGITGWITGHPFGPYALDFAFPDRRVAVEVDGWAWHVDAERFRTDRRKGNALTAAGWTLLRFTWHDLHDRPAQVLAQIRAVLDAIGT
jgi:very-short-patch-repair endonuclease